MWKSLSLLVSCCLLHGNKASEQLSNDLEIFSPFFDDGSDLFRPQVPKRARSSLQSVLQLGRLKRLQDDLLNLENDKNLDLNFAYPAIKRQQGSRYVLPLGRLKRTRIQPPNPKRQPKSILQIGRLKRDEILDNNDDINLAEIEANQHLDVDIKRLGILPLGRLRKTSGFQCNERSRFCRNGSEAARDLFERIGKAHVPMKSILPIGRLKRMDTERFENVQDEDDDSIFNMEKKLSGIKMILPIGRL